MKGNNKIVTLRRCPKQVGKPRKRIQKITPTSWSIDGGRPMKWSPEEMPRIKWQRERCPAEKDSYQIGVWMMETNSSPKRCSN